MKLLHRLERLERSATATRVFDEDLERRENEENSRIEAAWAIMSQTMSEEHARMVVEAYVAGMQDVRHPDWGSPAGALLRRCLDALQGRPHWRTRRSSVRWLWPCPRRSPTSTSLTRTLCLSMTAKTAGTGAPRVLQAMPSLRRPGWLERLLAQAQGRPED